MSGNESKRIKYLLFRMGIVVFDVLMVVCGVLVSYWATNWQGSLQLTITVNEAVIGWVAANLVLAITLFILFHLYTLIYAAVGFSELVKIIVATIIIAICNFIFVLAWGRSQDIGYRAIAIYTLIFFFGTFTSRFAKRFINTARGQLSNFSSKKVRVMIVGFNNDAFTLVRTMSSNVKSRYKVVCIVDDDEENLGRRIYDVRVVGSTHDVAELAQKFKVQEIFVAVPSLSKHVQREILHRCKECKLPLRLLPELSKMTHGEISVSKLRNVEIEDLLGREQISTNLGEVMGYIAGKTVLVTGGGGSIGSELCRQIALQKPKQLIILDIYENNAYDIEQELRRHYPDLNLLTLIASVRDRRKMFDVFEKHRPEIVFNAAAHKHVPLMETSPNEAVKNNVFGTLNVAQAADKYEVETFVQISTDKAVNPTNIMGATKRICEMIIQTIGKHSKKTKFVAVRFGNVLGSNGSVIPLFKQQIAEGGPVTITHKDIIRYFMTIPEAVSLVLQAGAYAKGGQIFVLDMGNPVKIYDLAYNLIKLSGYEPNVDIEICCTGLRPGEKLFEERLMAEEGLQKTENGLINIAQPIPLDEESFWTSLDKLNEAAHEETERMKDWVKELVPTYTIDRRESAAVTYLKSEAQKQLEEAQTTAEN